MMGRTRMWNQRASDGIYNSTSEASIIDSPPTTCPPIICWKEMEI
jgi:hypothetical protein